MSFKALTKKKEIKEASGLKHFDFGGRQSKNGLASETVTNFFIQQAKDLGLSFVEVKNFINEEESMYISWKDLRKALKPIKESASKFKRIAVKPINEASTMSNTKAIVDTKNNVVLLAKSDQYEEALVDYIKNNGSITEDDLKLIDTVQQA